MNQLTEKSIGCPYCGETIDVLLDAADLDQQYIEDCQVCCKPIIFKVFEDADAELGVNVYSEDDAF
ncbi:MULTISPECIES: CPXCG motif-containing cysteine-rich protein [Pseudoalteromonas]|uniref:CPXCG motif-containing cysteine-rich protein n=1 Tax=Pseudoalteromonas translucida (strain TAC 125) TaxID=326442 RepID=Q3IGQ7_PSET1|nr:MULTISPECIES: CPXCG motif-containing cysteine-rich protein [Pseudoalteromonas]MBB1369593.1 CPXCG motif-containing cysteine-rich protein [Pseudoalteromonas sp. SR45-4]MBE0419908.1 CPXCG motif-containing cysteine-rich protein [Pseudoalteromonas nigrifaciens]MBH0071284.1 CPXCG motif-containing cysteine-rich protein [Pseudoalteromonas sp. NZS127]MBH0092577.1 CPXCG motif-containing cysteine-rich protein [Pseudoalteromonas sp. SCQQ13]MBO7927595.1 CPXCG motif-containing cysteine-rich protein [Pseu|tara:strand:+ start:15395 stop:15592 length:198 start_codon:yes stop_codon:yes gene_type:complete